MQIEKSFLFQRIFIIAFWIRGTFGFISDEFLPFLSSVQPLIYLAFDIVLVLLGFATIRKKWDIILLISFIAISYTTTCLYNGLSLTFYLNGLRDFITFIFIIPIINYFFDNNGRKDRFVKVIDKQLYIFLIVQAFCIIWQFLKYGAGDHGGGSLGNFYSGITSTLIYLISFYLMLKRIDKTKYVQSLWENRNLIILLFPTFLNETKTSFIFLVLYFLLLLPIDRKIFIRILFIVPMIILLMWGAIGIYISSIGSTTEDVFSIDYYLDSYLLSDASSEYAQWLFDADNGDIEDIPRFTKLMLLDGIDEELPGHFYTGFGVGTFKGGTITETSDFYTQYEWLLSGSIPYIFHLIVQLGILGILWVLLFGIVRLVLPRYNEYRDMNLQLFIIFILLVLIFYNDSLRNPFFGFILMYVFEMSWIDQSEKSNQILTE